MSFQATVTERVALSVFLPKARIQYDRHFKVISDLSWHTAMGLLNIAFKKMRYQQRDRNVCKAKPDAVFHNLLVNGSIRTGKKINLNVPPNW